MRVISVSIAAIALIYAGAAVAAGSLKIIRLHPGQSVTIGKTRVMAVGQTVTVYTTPKPKTAFGDGTYRVGVDIQPGTYQAQSTSGACYWARLRGFSGGPADTIVNSFASATIVTIEPTDVGFKSTRCGPWVKV